MLKDPELIQAKEQIIEQIKSTFPEDKKNSALEQIESMNDEQFVEFLQKNNLLQDSNSQKSIFRSIASGEIPSYKIAQNNSAIAVLEINPLSKGHTIIIPKTAVNKKEQISQETNSLAKEVSEKISSELKPKEVKIIESNLFGEIVLNVIPVYEDTDLSKNERYKSEDSELQKLSKTLEIKEIIIKKDKPKEAEIKSPEKKVLTSKDIWLPKRIP